MAQNPKLGYDDETEALIDRMCAYVERKDFSLNDEVATELLLKTYDLFDLPRPKNVVWLKDIFDSTFIKSAWNAGNAGSAGNAWSAGNAGSAWNARSAGNARSAWSAGSAWSAWGARNARSAWSWTALDEDFYYFVFSYEYVRNPDPQYLPNDNDAKYLAYSDLLLQALEAGAGYRVEWEDTLYIVPTPLVKIDAQNRFHSETEPAIGWKNATEQYYLKGISFDKAEWQKIVNHEMRAVDVVQIRDTDKRAIAMFYLSVDEMIKGLGGAELLHVGKRGNKLYKCKNFMKTRRTEFGLLMKDASTDRQFFQFVEWRGAKTRGYDVKTDADAATAYMFRNIKGQPLPTEDYLSLLYEA
jgi:hypothetical protein